METPLKVIEARKIPTRRRKDLAEGRVGVVWLGQAGFLVETAKVRFLIDPYLSDSLAEKYRGTRYPHDRMMPVPVSPFDLLDIDYTFVTHGHADHLDPGSLPAIHRANPNCRFIVPRSCRGLAVTRGIPERRLMTLNAEESATLASSALEVVAIASAHEERGRDKEGNELYLGYIFSFARTTLYHSGDGVPYDGLTERLRRAAIDVFLMPINGRDEKRRSNGVPGNFTLQEAVEIARSAGGEVFIGHHHGMFDFNTIDPAEVRRWLQENPPNGKLDVLLAEEGKEYRFG